MNVTLDIQAVSPVSFPFSPYFAIIITGSYAHFVGIMGMTTDLSVEFLKRSYDNSSIKSICFCSSSDLFRKMDFINSQVPLYPDLAEEYATLGELHEKK